MSSRAIRAGRAFVELFADDSKLVRGLRKAQRKLQAFGKFATGIGAKLLGGAATFALPFIAATKIFAGFSDQMLKVKGITGATAEEFKMLEEKAKELGRSTSFTAGEVAGAMVELGRAGFKPKQIDEAIASVLALSRATDTELPRAAEIAGGVLRGFGLSIDQTARVADVLTATANSSAQGLEDIGESMKVLAPIASEAGESIEDVSTLIGILANNMIKGSLAGNSVARAYKNLSNSKVQKALKEQGVEAVDAAGNLRPLADILRELGIKTKNLGSAARLNIFETLFGRGQAAALKLAKAGASFDDLNDKIRNSGGVAQKTSKIMDSGIGGSLRRLGSAIEGIAIAVGSAIAPMLEAWAEKMSKVAAFITKTVKANKPFMIAMVKTIVLVGAIGAGLITMGVALGIAGALLGGIATLFSTLAAVIGTVVSVVATVAGAILSPLGLIIAAVIAAVALVVMEWDSISALMIDVWDSVVGAFSSAWTEFVTFFKSSVAALRAGFQAGVMMIKIVWANIVKTLKTAWAVLGSFVSESTKAFVDSFISIVEGAKRTFIIIWTVAAEAFRTIFQAISGWFAQVWNGLLSGLAGAVSSFAGFFSSTWQNTMSTAGDEFGAFKKRALSAWGGIRDAIAAGDLGLAFKIVTLALKAEFIRLVGALKSKWSSFVGFFSTLWTNAVFGLSAVMTNAWAGLQSFWWNLTDTLADAWSIFTSFIEKTWNSTVGFLIKAWNGLKRLVGQGDDTKSNEQIDKETASENEKVDNARNAKIMQRIRDRDKALKKIEDTRSGAIEELQLEVKRREDARQKADASELAANDQAVAAARDELAKAVAKAKQAREESDKEDEKGNNRQWIDSGELEAIRLSKMGSQLKTGKKAAVEGSFSSFARFSSGTSATDQRAKMLKQLEKIEKHTRKSSRAPERTVPLL